MVLATSKKTKDKELSLGAYPSIARGVGVVVEGACLLAVLTVASVAMGRGWLGC